MLMVQGLELGYNNLQQQLNGLEGFYGMDMVNASIDYYYMFDNYFFTLIDVYYVYTTFLNFTMSTFFYLTPWFCLQFLACRFDRDLKWGTRVEIVPIHYTSSSDF